MTRLSALPVQALRLVLKPVVRFFLQQSRSFQEFTTLAKDVFVEVAGEELERTGEKVTISRLSIVTGIHRDEVARLTRHDEEKDVEVASVLSRVIGQWEQDKRFLTADGKPKILKNSGKNNEFWKLVQSVSKHVNPAALLKELERIDAVKVSANGVELTSGIAFATPNVVQGARVLARDIDTLISAVTENLAVGKSVNLHLSTYYDNIYEVDIDRLREWLATEGSKFHRTVRDHVSESDSDINFDPQKGRAGGKVMIGTFSLVVPPSPEKSPESLKKVKRKPSK